MKKKLFLFVTCILWSETLGFYGGCMSFSTIQTDIPGKSKVKIYFLNGWKLHQGPCYNCTENDEGSDVTALRKQYIIDTHKPNAFGSWSFEVEVQGIENDQPKNITFDINNNIKDIVLMVNKHEEWELESSEINLLVDKNTVQRRRFDIMFENVNDGELTNMGKGIEVFLQVKVDPCERTDTKKPNNSPVVLIKPYYRLEHGKTHSINIPAIDNDDDSLECEFSIYVEAGKFRDIVKNLTGLGILTMNKLACVFTINLNNTRFSVGDTFALPITIKDYSRRDIASATSHTAYSTPIGRVTALMFFEITGKTDPPKFISPTPPNNQEYTVYIGGDFHVSVYVKPTDSTRKIVKFNFLRRDGFRVQQTNMNSVPGDSNAVYISMKWSPVYSDIGKHIVCANAEDSEGVSTVELHCFRIDVKANIFRPNPPLPDKPYFASFPIRQDIICPKGSYCRFPIYAATENEGGILGIDSTTMSIENVTIQYSSHLINGTIDTKVAQVEFLALTPGPRQICLNATDRFQWTVRCLIVTVERRDPCESKPCFNNGRCSAFKDRSGFKCTCDATHEGTLCENGIQFCNQTPCIGSNACMEVDLPPFFLCLQCPSGKTGVRCDNDIDVCHSNPCSENELCQQNKSSYHCLSGNIYVNQQCPHTCLKTETSVCVKNQCVCALKPKSNETCLSNQTEMLITSNEPYFIPPTPFIGSLITCDVNLNCEFPIYIYSETTPKLSIFNGKKMLDMSGRKISLSSLEKDMNGVYRSTTVLAKSKDSDQKYHEFDLCLNVAKISSPQDITDRRCFHVKDIKLPLVSGEQHISQNPNCIFATPTLPRESIIGCRKGQSCHFFMYAEETNGNCLDMITNDPSTGVFRPINSSGLCRYEVVYTNTSMVGTNTVCFMICSKGESRCYQMYTNDIPDQCATNPCLNNAYCQTESSGSFQCHCREGFWGKRCEKGFCNNQSFCQNNAVCFTSDGNTGCFCRLGFEGLTCGLDINRNITGTTENGGHFTHLSLIESLTCYINEPCTMPISITSNVHFMPTIEVGFSDKTLEIQSLHLEPSAQPGGIVLGTLTVVGHELGLRTICLDSVANPRTARIEDQICFRINVTQGNFLEPIQKNPFFVDPTLPTSTVLQCTVNQQCYLNLWARNRVGVEKCPQLEVDKTIEDGVYIFPLHDTINQPCVFESVILIDNVTDLQLCFSLPFDASLSQTANVQKDTRCYIIRVLPKLTVKGSCAGISCYNDGFCDGRSPSSQCLCRSGFSDFNCSKEFGIAQGNNSNAISQAKFGDVALPALVRCPLLKNCSIPFSVTDTSNSNFFNVTWNGTNFDSVTISLSLLTGSRDLSGDAVVVHNVTGKDEFCLTLVIRGDVYDSVCCFILTEQTIVPQPLDNGQGLFISPSPSNNSEFSCTPGQPCHVTFKTNKGDDQKCPELQDRSTMPVHIFTALFPNECQRDVLIESKNSTQGTEKYCFQTNSLGILSEVRCITIHFENHVLPPPPPTTTTTTSTTKESPTTVKPSTTTPPSATMDNDYTSSNIMSASLPGNGPEPTTTDKNKSTRQIEQVASKETTPIIGSGQITTKLGTARTTQLKIEQTITALGTGQQTTLIKEETTTTLAAGQITTMLAAGQTTSTLALGQTTTTLASGQTTTTLASGQTTPTLAARKTTTTLVAEQNKTTLATGETTTTPAAGQNKTTLATGETTPTLGSVQTTTLASGQTITTLGAGQTTTIFAAGQTTTLAAGQTTPTLAEGQKTTTLAAGQNKTTLATGETTTTLAAGQNKTILATGETIPTLAEGQTTTNLVAGQNKTNLATGETTTTLAAGQNKTTLATGQTTTTLAAGQTSTTLAAGQTLAKFVAGQTTTGAERETKTTFATKKTTRTMQPKSETCDVVDVQEWAKKGRVKCECFHPTGGTTTTVIVKNPQVSGKSLMVAAGLGSGAMVTMLGTAVLLYAVTQKYGGLRKTGPDSDISQQKKKLSITSCPDKKQLQ